MQNFQKYFLPIVLFIFLSFVGWWIFYMVFLSRKIVDFKNSGSSGSEIYIQIDRNRVSDSQISSFLSSNALLYSDDNFLRFKTTDDVALKIEQANIPFIKFPAIEQMTDSRVFLVTIKDPLTDAKTQVLANYGSIIFNYPLKKNSFLVWGSADLGERFRNELQIVEYAGDLKGFEHFAPEIFKEDGLSDHKWTFRVKYLYTKNEDANGKLTGLKKSGLEVIGRTNTLTINEQYDVLDLQVNGTYEELLSAMRNNPEIFYVYSAER